MTIDPVVDLAESPAEAKLGPLRLPTNLGRTDSDFAARDGESGNQKFLDQGKGLTTFVTQKKGSQKKKTWLKCWKFHEIPQTQKTWLQSQPYVSICHMSACIRHCLMFNCLCHRHEAGGFKPATDEKVLQLGVRIALQASRIQLARLLEILVGLQRDSHFAVFALNPKNREDNRIYFK